MDDFITALRAIGESTRLRILHLLQMGELTVSELTLILAQSQPRISRHLKLLVDAGLIGRHPEGSWVFYRACAGGYEALLRAVLGHMPCEEEVLMRDRARFDAVRSERAKKARDYFNANAARWDELRALHISDAAIEAELAVCLGDTPLDCLVDLGTGTGRVLELLSPRAERAYGFDLSPDMLRLARTRLDAPATAHCEIRQADIRDLPLAGESADAVVLHQVLHFLDDPPRAVLEAGRILRKGGRLLVVDFAPHEMESLRTEHAHRYLGFAERDMRGWLMQAGLKTHPPKHFAGALTVTMWLATKAKRARQ